MVKIELEVINLAKNRNKKDRLPFHIVKDSHNLIRLKLKNTIDGVTKRYGQIPRRIWTSSIVILGILLIIIISLFSNTKVKPPLDEIQSGSGVDVIINDSNQLQTNLPSMPEVKLNSSELEIDKNETIDEQSIGEEPTQTTLSIIPESVNIVGNLNQDLKIIYPLRRPGMVITNYGWYFHPILESWRFHQGVDLRCQKNDLVMAAADGEVIKVFENYYEAVIIILDHGNGWTTTYGQLKEVYYKVGDRVSSGQKLGIIGQSETAIEPHLHFEIRKNGELCNPEEYLQRFKS